jgi:hypothetical protein
MVLGSAEDQPVPRSAEFHGNSRQDRAWRQWLERVPVVEPKQVAISIMRFRELPAVQQQSRPIRAASHITNEFDAKFVSISDSNAWLANFSGSPGSVSLTVTTIGTEYYTTFPDVTIPGGKLGDGDLDNRPLYAVQELETMGNHYVLSSPLTAVAYQYAFTG